MQPSVKKDTETCHITIQKYELTKPRVAVHHTFTNKTKVHDQTFAMHTSPKTSCACGSKKSLRSTLSTLTWVLTWPLDGKIVHGHSKSLPCKSAVKQSKLLVRRSLPFFWDERRVTTGANSSKDGPQQMACLGIISGSERCFRKHAKIGKRSNRDVTR